MDGLAFSDWRKHLAECFSVSLRLLFVAANDCEIDVATERVLFACNASE